MMMDRQNGPRTRELKKFWEKLSLEQKKKYKYEFTNFLTVMGAKNENKTIHRERP